MGMLKFLEITYKILKIMKICGVYKSLFLIIYSLHTVLGGNRYAQNIYDGANYYSTDKNLRRIFRRAIRKQRILDNRNNQPFNQKRSRQALLPNIKSCSCKSCGSKENSAKNEFLGNMKP